MSKKYHTCPYCGSQVRPITNSDILKAVGKTSSKTPNITLNKIKDIGTPKKILNTGRLLSWLNENTSELLNDLINLYPKVKHWENYNFAHPLEWKYECLERNEKLMQTSLSLKQFIVVNAKKELIQAPKQKHYQANEIDADKYFEDREQYQQACKEILFDTPIKLDLTNVGEVIHEYIGESDYKIATKHLITGEWEFHFNITVKELIIKIPDIKGTEHFWGLIFK